MSFLAGIAVQKTETEKAFLIDFKIVPKQTAKYLKKKIWKKKFFLGPQHCLGRCRGYRRRPLRRPWQC